MYHFRVMKPPRREEALDPAAGRVGIVRHLRVEGKREGEAAAAKGDGGAALAGRADGRRIDGRVAGLAACSGFATTVTSSGNEEEETRGRLCAWGKA